MPDSDGFMKKFEKTWAAPDPESFADLFHADGELLHPGMTEPLASAGVPDYIRRLTTVCPDLSLTVDRWSAADDYVLIEWTMGGTLFGKDVRWSGCDRFTLRGDRATYGVAYFDSLPLWALIDPSMAQDKPLEETLAEFAGAA